MQPKIKIAPHISSEIIHTNKQKRAQENNKVFTEGKNKQTKPQELKLEFCDLSNYPGNVEVQIFLE